MINTKEIYSYTITLLVFVVFVMGIVPAPVSALGWGDAYATNSSNDYWGNTSGQDSTYATNSTNDYWNTNTVTNWGDTYATNSSNDYWNTNTSSGVGLGDAYATNSSNDYWGNTSGQDSTYATNSSNDYWNTVTPVSSNTNYTSSNSSDVIASYIAASGTTYPSYIAASGTADSYVVAPQLFTNNTPATYSSDTSHFFADTSPAVTFSVPQYTNSRYTTNIPTFNIVSNPTYTNTTPVDILGSYYATVNNGRKTTYVTPATTNTNTYTNTPAQTVNVTQTVNVPQQPIQVVQPQPTVQYVYNTPNTYVAQNPVVATPIVTVAQTTYTPAYDYVRINQVPYTGTNDMAYVLTLLSVALLAFTGVVYFRKNMVVAFSGGNTSMTTYTETEEHADVQIKEEENEEPLKLSLQNGIDGPRLSFGRTN